MPRKNRPLDRDTGVVRDANLIVIASEDEFAADVYFKQFRSTHIRIKMLLPEEGRGSPRHISDRLDAYKNEYEIGEGDQLWYCGDTDHWIDPSHIQTLREVLAHCKQSKYGIALSNPCFELWLLLHFAELQEEVSNCRGVITQLSAAAGGYSKRLGCTTAMTSEMVQDAMRRAKAMDDSSLIPNVPSTQVYLILESILERRMVELG
jgi:hypothetical protein